LYRALQLVVCTSVPAARAFVDCVRISEQPQRVIWRETVEEDGRRRSRAVQPFPVS
jgi:hypothetical protein